MIDIAPVHLPDFGAERTLPPLPLDRYEARLTILRPGMALQMDVIPISAGPFCCTNAEDGVLLADERLRTGIASRYPAMWTRVMARRDFMRDAIGIDLDPSVLPLSNIPAWLPPYALNPEHALIRTASRARGA